MHTHCPVYCPMLPIDCPMHWDRICLAFLHLERGIYKVEKVHHCTNWKRKKKSKGSKAVWLLIPSNSKTVWILQNRQYIGPVTHTYGIHVSIYHHHHHHHHQYHHPHNPTCCLPLLSSCSCRSPSPVFVLIVLPLITVWYTPLICFMYIAKEHAHCRCFYGNDHDHDHGHNCVQQISKYCLRESINKKKSGFYGHFPYPYPP